MRGCGENYGLPRETRSISARTMRSTIPGRLSSSHDLSIGRSISRTRSSSVRAFCPITVWASVLNALSTAFTVSLEINPRSGTGGGSGLLAKTTSGFASIVRKLGAGPGDGVAADVIDSVRSKTSGAAGCDAVGFGAAFGGPSSSASMASISSWLLAAAADVVGLDADGAAGLAGGAGVAPGAAPADCLAAGAVSGAL